MLNNSQWIPTGHWQKSSWKQNYSKYYHITRLNKRRRKKKKGNKTSPVPLGESYERGKFLLAYERTPFTGWEINWQRKGTSEAWRRVQHLDCRRQNRKRPAPSVLATFLHSAWDTCLLVWNGSWVLKHRLQWRESERGLGLTAQRQAIGSGV